MGAVPPAVGRRRPATPDERGPRVPRRPAGVDQPAQAPAVGPTGTAGSPALGRCRVHRTNADGVASVGALHRRTAPVPFPVAQRVGPSGCRGARPCTFAPLMAPFLCQEETALRWQGGVDTPDDRPALRSFATAVTWPGRTLTANPQRNPRAYLIRYLVRCR
jgi:hypothetical protein